MTSRLIPATLLLCVLLPVASGCSSVGYYSQSISGHLDLWWHRQPVTELLTDETIDPELKTRLKAALEMRDFATQRLMLPDNGSYRGFTDLNRRHVVWNVYAAPEFSLELKKWCFFFAGCVGYKGYYAEDDALALAAELRNEGMDVHVGGVDAYSTLGWFDDPLLSTIINRPAPSLAGLIFHELAHQQFYLKGDTAFNESFAGTVELEGVKLWLAQHGDEQIMLSQTRRWQLQREFLELIREVQSQLKEIYRQALPDTAKREAKAQALASFKAQYAHLKQRWHGYKGYDKWLQGEINNAKLGSIALYEDWKPAFQQLFKEANGDFTAFYASVSRLGAMEKEMRDTRLQALLAAAIKDRDIASD